ncbi:TRAP transporter small permease subunit [Xanthobacter autotrophicus]|jgi:TRAP-type mannitol/chloroaromatic compound transport system permease small subunit|uniref:TRAP transporter small permease protein n=1 Tax=Xanthobacter autotrophicus TaxID=280 RepID=A0A6C1KML7_XANAU|nr:TRAP transporter small permease subunit [Xanthobacter autotrophicus]TLX44424.1 TRAP transporter small permease subunit [Xanthobacter autotrophicus]
MSTLLALARGIDAVNMRIGKAASWLILVAILVSAANAVVRKLFDLSSNSWLELQWVLFAAVFLLCGSWTLMDNEHIRIDIVNARLRKRVRDGIDIFGHIFFLLPFSILLLWTSWPFFMASWSINEQSLNAGGLPQWPAKLLVPVGFFFLTLQGFSELIKRIAIFTGRMEDPNEREGGSHAALAAEAERLLAEVEVPGAGTPVVPTTPPAPKH